MDTLNEEYIDAENVGQAEATCIPEQFAFLRDKHRGILKALAGTGISIEHLELCVEKYYVNYYFRRRGDMACMHITFNGRGRFNTPTCISRNTTSEPLFKEICAVVDHSDCRPVVAEVAECLVEPIGREAICAKLPGFMHEVYDEISGLASAVNASVYDVCCREWCCCFTFRKEEQLAAFDFHYNKRNQVSAVTAKGGRNYCDSLTREVETCLGI